jgi:hypothetical protein
VAQALSQVEAYRRRLLLIGTAADYARLKLDQQTRRLLANPSLRFLSLEEAIEPDDPIIRSLAAKDLLHPGTLLVQSFTVTDQYTRLSGISDRTAEAKLNATVRVCQLLGACRIEIRHAEFTSNESGFKRTGSAQVTGIGKGSINTESSTMEVGGLRLRSVWVFRGGKPQIDDADRALASSGLQDEALQSMIDFFRTGNWPTSHEFEISTTQEMRRVRDMVGDLSIPATFKAHAELASFKASGRSYQFGLWVDFP